MVFSQMCRPASMTCDDLRKVSNLSRGIFLDSVQSSGDKDIDTSPVWRNLKRSWERLYPRAYWQSRPPTGICSHEKVPGKQRNKVRPIDDYKASLVNFAVIQNEGVASLLCWPSGWGVVPFAQVTASSPTVGICQMHTIKFPCLMRHTIVIQLWLSASLAAMQLKLSISVSCPSGQSHQSQLFSECHWRWGGWSQPSSAWCVSFLWWFSKQERIPTCGLLCRRRVLLLRMAYPQAQTDGLQLFVQRLRCAIGPYAVKWQSMLHTQHQGESSGTFWHRWMAHWRREFCRGPNERNAGADFSFRHHRFSEESFEGCWRFPPIMPLGPGRLHPNRLVPPARKSGACSLRGSRGRLRPRKLRSSASMWLRFDAKK